MTALALIAVAVLVFVAVTAVVRERRTREDPLITLRRELAEGKITSDEFLERESALRSSAPKRGSKRW